MGHDVRQLVRKRVNNPQVPKPLVGRADGDPAQTFSRASRSHEGQEMLWGTRPPTPALPVSSPEELGWDSCAAWGKRKGNGDEEVWEREERGVYSWVNYFFSPSMFESVVRSCIN